MIARAWSKSRSGARQASRHLSVDGTSVIPTASQLVQLAGMSERLPSGCTISNIAMPQRFMVLIICNEHPSNGCRARVIVTKHDMSRRWVVCDGFL